MSPVSRQRALLLAGAVVLAAVLVPFTARGIASRFRNDSLWANAAASVGGVDKPGDFGYVFLVAANDVLAGRSPYMSPDDFVGPPQAPYAYPPALALALVPLALVPEHVAGSFVPGVLFSLVLIACMIGALLLLDVRDWRCYPVALAYSFTFEALEYGAVGPVLLLLVALGWRYRRRTWSGAAFGAAIVIKLFLWPLLVWLVFIRQRSVAVAAFLVAVCVALASWAVIGFAGLTEYPALLDKLVDVEAENSYSATAVFQALGLSQSVSRLLVALSGGALLLSALRAARSAQAEPVERDRSSLTLTLAAALVLTPILWLHYLVLLVVPIALARPRLSLLWLLPLTLTAFELAGWYRGWPTGALRALLSVALVVGATIAVALRANRVAPTTS